MIKPSSSFERRANERAKDLVLNYDEQITCAVLAVTSRELRVIAKAIKRSRNIKGDIVRDLWLAYSKITAAVSIL